MSTSTLTPSGRLAFACPHCERRLKSKRTSAGKRRRCRKCEEQFRIPFPVEDAAEGLTALATPKVEAEEAPAKTKIRPVKRRPLRGKAPKRTRRTEREDMETQAPGDTANVDPSSPYAPPATGLEPRKRRRRKGKKGGSRRDLSTESHLRALAIWSVLGGILMFGMMGLMMLMIPAMGRRVPMQFLGIIGGMGLLGSAYIASGIGLWTYQGWARVMTLVLTAIGVAINVLQVFADPNMASGFGSLVGLAWSVAIIGTVGSAAATRICSADYRQRVKQNPAMVPFHTSPFFWLPLAFMALGLVLFMLLFVAAMVTAL